MVETGEQKNLAEMAGTEEGVLKMEELTPEILKEGVERLAKSKPVSPYPIYFRFDGEEYCVWAPGVLKIWDPTAAGGNGEWALVSETLQQAILTSIRLMWEIPFPSLKPDFPLVFSTSENSGETDG